MLYTLFVASQTLYLFYGLEVVGRRTLLKEWLPSIWFYYNFPLTQLASGKYEWTYVKSAFGGTVRAASTTQFMLYNYPIVYN